MSDLTGKRIAFLTSPRGVERAELVGPREALTGWGATTILLTPGGEDAATVNGDLEPAGSVPADGDVADADVGDYDLLVVPGGTVNADTLRLDADAVALVHAFAEARKPVGAICHGPWVLVESGDVRGKDLTSYPSLRTDLTNAGATWRDEAPVVCRKEGWTLVTARNPDDVPVFNQALSDALTS